MYFRASFELERRENSFFSTTVLVVSTTNRVQFQELCALLSHSIYASICFILFAPCVCFIRWKLLDVLNLFLRSIVFFGLFVCFLLCRTSSFLFSRFGTAFCFCLSCPNFTGAEQRGGGIESA